MTSQSWRLIAPLEPQPDLGFSPDEGPRQRWFDQQSNAESAGLTALHRRLPPKATNDTTQNCLIRLERTRSIPAVPGAATVIFALAVMVAVACSGPQPVTPSEGADATAVPEPTPTTALTTNSTAVPEPTPTRLPIDGETWILESVDGRPLVHGMFATLTIDGPQFGGFDGCNSFGGPAPVGNAGRQTRWHDFGPSVWRHRCRLPDGRHTRSGEPVPRSDDTAGQGPCRR